MSEQPSCGGPSDQACCEVMAVVGVDDRGQLVLPKEVRTRAGISAGDKLAIVSWSQGGEVCCLTMVKPDRIADAVGGVIGSMMTGAEQPMK